MTQYEKIAEKYTDGTKMEHPQRKYMVYPTWLNACGNVRGLKILDVGCGGGDSSRLLAKRGARVLGVDKEIKNLRFALQQEREYPLGVKYQGAEAEYLPLFIIGRLFDLITPTYLLHYSKTKEDLSRMISGMANLLVSGGKIVAILADPKRPVIDYYPGICSEVRWLGKSWEEGSETEVVYLDEQGKKVLSFRECYWWKKETYEHILVQSGFTDIKWIRPRMNDEGKKLFPNWRDLEDFCITILSAEKPYLR